MSRPTRDSIIVTTLVVPLLMALVVCALLAGRPAPLMPTAVAAPSPAATRSTTRLQAVRAQLAKARKKRAKARAARVTAYLKRHCIEASPAQIKRLPNKLERRCRPIRRAAIKRGELIYAPHRSGHVPRGKIDWSGSVLATWYGPGFYGQRTGCGSTLRAQTWGIAHRTLPCGTVVAIRHGKRTVAVPVVDRGPFSGAQVDLTGRVREYVGFVSGSVKMGIVTGERVPIRHL